MYLSPKKLKHGSRVAIVAPSSPFKSDELTEGLDVIREMGLVPVLGPCVKNLRSDGIHAAPLAERVDELNWAFRDQRINGIITVVGGMGSAALLPYLDYDVIRASRKVILGKSDITALSCGILAKSGLISVNGPSARIRLDKGVAHARCMAESLRHTLRLLMSDGSWDEQPFALNEFMPRTIMPGSATGCAIGGNADTFVHLLGTDFFPSVDDCVLFLEDVHKSGTALGRELIHLRLAGVLDRISGTVLGEFAEVDKKVDERTPAIEDVIQDHFVGGAPAVYGYSFSHGLYVSPIPIGAACDMDADTGVISFDFAMSP